eukprot:1157521-Pelagomonas_calceolata.AAC.13
MGGAQGRRPQALAGHVRLMPSVSKFIPGPLSLPHHIQSVHRGHGSSLDSVGCLRLSSGLLDLCCLDEAHTGSPRALCVTKHDHHIAVLLCLMSRCSLCV